MKYFKYNSVMISLFHILKIIDYFGELRNKFGQSRLPRLDLTKQRSKSLCHKWSTAETLFDAFADKDFRELRTLINAIYVSKTEAEWKNVLKNSRITKIIQRAQHYIHAMQELFFLSEMHSYNKYIELLSARINHFYIKQMESPCENPTNDLIDNKIDFFEVGHSYLKSLFGFIVYHVRLENFDTQLKFLRGDPDMMNKLRNSYGSFLKNVALYNRRSLEVTKNAAIAISQTPNKPNRFIEGVMFRKKKGKFEPYSKIGASLNYILYLQSNVDELRELEWQHLELGYYSLISSMHPSTEDDTIESLWIDSELEVIDTELSIILNLRRYVQRILQDK